MNNVNVTILNTKDELLSFPLDQSIYLEFSEAVEDTQLKSCICLIRNLNGQGLFNISDKYNQSIGYVREKFDLEDINIEVISTSPTFKIKVTPLSTLAPGFNYTLFIDKKLSSEFLVVDKIVSKSKSNITVDIKNPSNINHTLEIISNPVLTSTSNIIKININSGSQSKTEVLNLKVKKSLVFENVIYNFEDSVYALGEKFEILTISPKTLEESLFINIKASLTEDIKAIKDSTDSTRLDYNNILDYYQSKESEIIEEGLKADIEYKGINVFYIKLPNTVKAQDIDIDNLEFKVDQAFDNYLLSTYSLYDTTKSYNYTITVESDNTLKVIVTEVTGPTP